MTTYTIYTIPEEDSHQGFEWQTAESIPANGADVAEGVGAQIGRSVGTYGYINNVGTGFEKFIDGPNLISWQTHLWFNTSTIPETEVPTGGNVKIYYSSNDGPQTHITNAYFTDADLPLLNVSLSQIRKASQINVLPKLGTNSRAVGVGGYLTMNMETEKWKWVNRAGMTKIMLISENQLTGAFIPSTNAESTSDSTITADYGGTSFTPVLTVTTATAPGTVPGAPTNLEVSDGGTDVQISWTPVTGATGHTVYRDGILVGSVSGTTGSFSDTPPLAGWHSYSVSATNANGEGDLTTPKLINWSGFVYTGGYRYLRPTGTKSASRWTDQTGGAGVVAAVDEEVPSRTDYARLQVM